MNIYYVSEISDKGNNAGTKARNDIENIFLTKGWNKINDFPIEAKIGSNSLLYYTKNYFNALRLAIKLKNIERGLVFYQYPILKRAITKKAINKINDNVNLCFLIHDLNSLRSPKEQRKILLKEEINVLNKAMIVITHNSKMSKILIDNGLKSKVIELEVFDYLNDKYDINIPRKFAKEVVYAGNLKQEKNNFLTDLLLNENLDFKLNLYGPNFDKESLIYKNIKYKGSFSPEEVICKLDGSFGLIWDGDSIDTCSGLYGEYLKYNNPHKLSLYISSRLPLIVWEESAVAEIVLKENIGFTVKSITEISEKINSITENEYHEYITNISKIRSKLAKGEYTNNAMLKAISALK